MERPKLQRSFRTKLFTEQTFAGIQVVDKAVASSQIIPVSKCFATIQAVTGANLRGYDVIDTVIYRDGVLTLSQFIHTHPLTIATMFSITLKNL